MSVPDITSQLKQLAGLVTGQLSPLALTDMTPVAVDRLCRLARSQGVAPLLYRRLQNAGLLPALPRTCFELLLEAHAQTAGYNFLAYEAARSWTMHLDAAGIPGIWLKGLPLSLSVYPAPDTRPMMDIDLLVPIADRDAALQLAERITGSRPVMLRPDQAIHAIFPVGKGERVKMELHWSLIAPPTSSMAPELDWFINRGMLLETEYGPICTLTPEAHLLYLCAHAQLGHGDSQFMLVRYLDMVQLIQAYAPLNWVEVVDQAVRLRWTYAVERALKMVQTFFGPEIEAGLPVDLPVQLADRRPANENYSLVQQRGEPSTRWERIQVRLQSEQPADRLRIALALLFPPPAYIRWRYQVTGWKMPFYYPYRWFDGLREWVRSK